MNNNPEYNLSQGWVLHDNDTMRCSPLTDVLKLSREALEERERMQTNMWNRLHAEGFPDELVNGAVLLVASSVFEQMPPSIKEKFKGKIFPDPALEIDKIVMVDPSHLAGLTDYIIIY